MKRNYILGLDLGTGSVGWSVVGIDHNSDPYRIIDLGARIFDSEVADLKDRRIARSTRRLIRRRAARISKTRNLFIKYGYLNKDEIYFFTDNGKKIPNKITLEKIGYDNILDLRIKGKNELLTYEELYVLLINYAKHRGFKSNRKVEEKDVNEKTEEGKLLSAVHGTEEAVLRIKKDNPQATVSDYLKEQFAIKGKMHNDENEYSYGITRRLIEEEVDIILDKQIEKNLINEDFKSEYKEALFKQLHFSSGPEEGPYSNPLAKSIGDCHFVVGQKRASRNSISYLKFVLAQKLTDLRYSTTESKILKQLSGEQIRKIVNDFAEGESIKYSDICKEIGIDCFIKNVDDLRKRKINKEKRKEDFIKLKKGKFGDVCIELKKELKKAGIITDDKYIDLLSECFSRYKTDYEIKDYLSGNRQELKEINCPDELIEFALAYKNSNKFKTFGSVSLEFIYRVFPHLLEGKDLYTAKQLEGFSDTIVENDEELDNIPIINDVLEKLEKTISNRGVVRTIVETRKVVNAIIEKYGMPYEVHLEMARDLTLSKKEKDKYQEKQNENYIIKQKKINKIYNKYSELFNNDILRITSQDILKYELFEEQNGICLYTLAATGDEKEARISESKIFNNDYVEVEHIIPYSKSFDDRKSNKILVLKKQNIEKGDNIPGKYYKGQAGYDKYCSYIEKQYGQKENKYNQAKKARLLSEDISEFLGDYHARTINDTRYAMIAFKDVINYSFPNLKVRTYVGALTAKLRAFWRLNDLETSYSSKKEDYKTVVDEERIKELEELMKKLSEFGENEIDDKEKEKKRKEIVKNIENSIKEGKKNRENHFHHMIDATIIACATDKIRINIEKQEILNRIETNSSIIELDMPEINEATGELVVDEITGEIKYSRVTIDSNYQNNFETHYNDKNSKFPIPYFWFVEELKVRALEMDEEVLKKKLKLYGYTQEEIDDVKPIIISHFYSGKASGALHEATYLGKRKSEGKNALVKKISLKSGKFKNKLVDKIFDKDSSQAYIYQTVKEWMGNEKDGISAYNKHHSFPVNKNGNEIKSVTVVVHDEIKEQFVLKEGQNNYVNKTDNIETWIYKKDGEDKLYFVGLDAYRLKNLKRNKELPMTLWYGQAKNYISLPFSKIESEGFKLYRKIIVGQTIEVTSNEENKCICIAGGTASGMFEVHSITGDGADLISSGLFIKKRTQYTLTVSTIKDVRPINIDVLGKIY